MAKRPEDPDDGWQARTHVIRDNPVARARQSGGDCLVIIYARNTAHLGRRYMLDGSPSEATVGRGADNAIVLESDAVSRRHARFERRGEGWWVVDNNSTNGTYVNDELVQGVQLRRGDHIKVGDTIFKYLAGTDVEAEFIQTIGTIMVTDGLTQAHNRRYLTEQLQKEIQRSRRHGRSLTLVMFDLDHFKRVNDTFGHLAGDYVLREVAGLARQVITGEQVFARYGGEEFAMLLPETELAEATTLAETLRARVAGHSFVFDGHAIPVTISMGIAAAADTTRDADDLIRAADTKLYAAKHGGRNRVVV